jgi:hypothetical protein
LYGSVRGEALKAPLLESHRFATAVVAAFERNEFDVELGRDASAELKAEARISIVRTRIAEMRHFIFIPLSLL